MKNFLKSAAHQHKDSQVRLAFINDLDEISDEIHDVIIEMARHDDDETVRIAAIDRLDDLNILRELMGLGQNEPNPISQAAEARLVKKLSDGEVSDVALRVLLSTHADRLAVAVASYSPSPVQRQSALSVASDESSLLLIVQQSRFHDTRLEAALGLSQHDSLRAALSAVRSKDKVVAKQIQQRLDEAAAAEADLIARRHAVSSTLKNVETLTEGVWTPQHGGKLQAAKERWASFPAEDTKDSSAEFDLAVSKATVKLNEYTTAQQQAATVSPGSSENTADENSSADKSLSTRSSENKSSADTESVAPVAPVAKVEDPALDPVLDAMKPIAIDTLAATVEELQQKAQNDSDQSASKNVEQLLAYGASVAVLFDPPYELNKARPNALKARIKRISSLTDTHSVLPGIDVAEHVYVQELQAHLNLLQDRVGKAEQESADRIKATHRQFSALSGITKEGKWGPANSMLRRLQKKVAAMEPDERVSLDDKLSRAETQLAEMADWQDFAAKPKLEALCESMEALPAKELKPDALAKEVKELQNAWKALGVSRASNDLWGRFKTAGDTAYEPCKEWFDKKREERQVKIDAKGALCQTLESKLDSLSGDPDWKATVRLVNQSKREWSKNRVHDRKPDKALEKRFSDALKPYEEALGEQYAANAASKQALVEKVEALATGDITQHTANQAKSLLSAWKLVGVMRRKEDQALWETFNGHLGTIFKHQHKVEREKQRAGLEHVYRAKDIIKRLKQLSKGSSLDEAEVQTLSSEFQGLADFPDRDKKFLIRDFRSAVDACSRVQENASKKRVEAESEERRRLAGLCEQLEAAVEQGSGGEHLVDDVKHGWDATEARVAPDIAALLVKRRDQAIGHLESGSKPDYAKNESTRRDLLIQMEIAAGVDTPAEDKARRMQYQLQHLQEGMTSAGVKDSKLVLQQLEKDWLTAGPAGGSVSDALNSRYLKAYKR